jgi:hypothetical protein
VANLLGVHLGRDTLSFTRWPFALLLSRARTCSQSPPLPGTPTNSSPPVQDRPLLSISAGKWFVPVRRCLHRTASVRAVGKSTWQSALSLTNARTLPQWRWPASTAGYCNGWRSATALSAEPVQRQARVAPLGPPAGAARLPGRPRRCCLDSLHLVVQAGGRPGRVNKERDAAAKDSAAGRVIGAGNG